jgi:O-Antigen ligase
MAFSIAVFCLLAVIISIPLAVLKPKWVFYLFLAAALFGNLLAGYIREAGNLGASRVWQPVDMLTLSLLLATLLLPSQKGFPANTIKKCLIVIAAISIFSMALGLVLYLGGSFKASRQLHFAVVILFAFRYFTDTKRVEDFLRFVAVLAIVMFAVQVLIRFGVYSPPSAELQAAGQLAGERGEMSLTPIIYLMLVSMAIARFSSKKRPYTVAALLLAIGFLGVTLSETRTYYGGLAVMAIAALLMMPGRGKVLLIYGLGAIIAITFAQKVGFNLFERFQMNRGHETMLNPLKAIDTVRSAEYSSFLKSYQEEPYFILTGRGTGATHYLPMAISGLHGEQFSSLEQDFYHSEYLGWLDKFGLTGFIALIIMLFACLKTGFEMARSNIPYLSYYGTLAFLFTATIIACSVFVPTFLHDRSGPFFICPFVIIANRYIIESNLQDENFYTEDTVNDEVLLT